MSAAIIAIAAVVLAVAGTAVNVQAQKEAAEDTQDIQEAQAFEQRQAETRKRIRERRITAARIKQSAANTGTGGSSGEAGALGSLSSQFATGASASSFAQESSSQLGAINSKLMRRQQVGTAIQSVGQVLGATASFQQQQPPTQQPNNLA